MWLHLRLQQGEPRVGGLPLEVGPLASWITQLRFPATGSPYAKIAPPAPPTITPITCRTHRSSQVGNAAGQRSNVPYAIVANIATVRLRANQTWKGVGESPRCTTAKASATVSMTRRRGQPRING